MKVLFKNTIYLGIFVLIISLLISCSSTSATEISSTAEVSEGVTVDQSEQSQPVENEDSQPAESEPVSNKEAELPEDLPIMPGYRKLSVTSKGTNVSYEVDGTIADVVGFYQEELPNFAWEMTRSPDNSLSAMGAMTRVNENGDRLSINLQFNPMAEFVVVRVFISRSP